MDEDFIWAYFYSSKFNKMESNINHQVIRSYSREFSEKLSEEFFKNKTSISGDEILTFSKIRQINLFILRILFEQWKSEFARLRSPYFDYESEEVQKAARAYMNVLSRNILIKKDDFLPLLEEATYETILLIFSPYEFYLREISRTDREQLSVPELGEMKKYIKVNNLLLQAYLDRLDSNGMLTLTREDAVKIFDEVCEDTKDTPEEFDEYLIQFSNVIPLDLDVLYSSTEENPVRKENEEGEEDTKSLNEKFKRKKRTLLDALSNVKKEVLVEIHEKQPIEDIKKSITLNQRFMFEKELFNGDKDEFNMVIDYLNNCESRAEAMDFIHENYVNKKGWDLEKTEVAELFRLIEKRFPEA